MATSYRMRMYKRRLWEQRAKIVGIGVSLWLGVVFVIVLAVTI
jgi:hypothetical protein